MVLKTFNLEENIYNKFSGFCKAHGMSMSRQIQMFIEAFLSNEPNAKKEYLDKLDTIRQGKFIRVESVSKKYGFKA